MQFKCLNFHNIAGYIEHISKIKVFDFSKVAIIRFGNLDEGASGFAKYAHAQMNIKTQNFAKF